MQLYLHHDLSKAWRGQDPFEVVQQLRGDVKRDLDGRRTLRFEACGQSYYLKLHTGVGWKEIVKSLVSFRLPVLDAGTEWRAIRRLREIGIDTLVCKAFGSKGWNPAKRISFLVTDELRGMRSLSTVSLSWPQSPPSARLKRQLIERLARISKTLHESGMNHRDYYLCHFLTNLPETGAVEDLAEFRLVLVDLHRAQIRTSVPRRWIVKDLAALYYSAMHIGLSRRDVFRFMKVYRGKGLRATLSEDATLWRKTADKARKFHLEFFGKAPPEIL